MNKNTKKNRSEHKSKYPDKSSNKLAKLHVHKEGTAYGDVGYPSYAEHVENQLIEDSIADDGWLEDEQ